MADQTNNTDKKRDIFSFVVSPSWAPVVIICHVLLSASTFGFWSNIIEQSLLPLLLSESSPDLTLYIYYIKVVFFLNKRTHPVCLIFFRVSWNKEHCNCTPPLWSFHCVKDGPSSTADMTYVIVLARWGVEMRKKWREYLFVYSYISVDRLPVAGCDNWGRGKTQMYPLGLIMIRDNLFALLSAVSNKN